MTTMIDKSLPAVPEEEASWLYKRVSDIYFCRGWLCHRDSWHAWWQEKRGFKIAQRIAFSHGWSREALMDYCAAPCPLPPSQLRKKKGQKADKYEQAQVSTFEPAYKSHPMLQRDQPDVKGEDGIWRDHLGRQFYSLREWLDSHAGERGAEYIRKVMGEAAQA
jgi:hypothetical protein